MIQMDRSKGTSDNISRASTTIGDSDIPVASTSSASSSTSVGSSAGGDTKTGSTKKVGLDRLLERQEQEIDNIEKRIELWTKYQTEYNDLKKLVNNITDKVKHPHRIPLAGSKLAFVDGHIIHTNEILVLLGDNYFALRSARQASQIIDRRLEGVKDMLKKSQEAKQQTQDWLNATREHKQAKEEFVEIIETM